MLIVSFVSVVALGWIVFRSPALTPAVVDAAFITTLVVFLGCVVAECGDAIARSTKPGRFVEPRTPPTEPGPPSEPENAPRAATPIERAPDRDRGRMDFRHERRMTG